MHRGIATYPLRAVLIGRIGVESEPQQDRRNNGEIGMNYLNKTSWLFFLKILTIRAELEESEAFGGTASPMTNERTNDALMQATRSPRTAVLVCLY